MPAGTAAAPHASQLTQRLRLLEQVLPFADSSPAGGSNFAQKKKYILLAKFS